MLTFTHTQARILAMCEKACKNCILRRYAFKNRKLDVCVEKNGQLDQNYHVVAGLTPMNPTRQPVDKCDNPEKFTPKTESQN